MSHRHTTAGQGESAPFHFETTWRVPADLGRVWGVLSRVHDWSTWWPGMHAVQGSGEGDRAWLMVRSPLGYRLRFTIDLVSAEAPYAAELAVDGDLRGVGSLRARRDGDGAELKILWCVVTRRRLVRALRPLASWAHAVVMAAGQWGLRRACS